VLALCLTSNKTFICNSIRWFTKPKIPSLLRSILCIPQKSPLTLLEHVICVFEIGVGLVFVGFGLFQICLCFSFSPYSKYHALQRGGYKQLSTAQGCSHTPGTYFLSCCLTKPPNTCSPLMCCPSTTPRSLEAVFILEWEVGFEDGGGRKGALRDDPSTIANCQELQTAMPHC